MHVEHIVPKKAASNELFHDSDWVDKKGNRTDQHKKYLNSLGNQCILSQEDNVSLGNHTPWNKFHGKKAKDNSFPFPFNTSPFHSAKSAHHSFTGASTSVRDDFDNDMMADALDGKGWLPEQMGEHSARIMKKIVEHFQPIE